MTGHRKSKGQSLRRFESRARARAMHTARVAQAPDPTSRVRAVAELYVSVLRRLTPQEQERAASRLVQLVGDEARRLDRIHDREGSVK